MHLLYWAMTALAVITAVAVYGFFWALARSAALPTPELPHDPDPDTRSVRAAVGSVLMAIHDGLPIPRDAAHRLASFAVCRMDDDELGVAVYSLPDPEPLVPGEIVTAFQPLDRAERHSHGASIFEERHDRLDSAVRASRRSGFDQVGQTMAEYAVVLGVITIGAVVAVGALSDKINATLNAIVKAMG
jgi:Flp pilus assembly pilin Flp